MHNLHQGKTFPHITKPDNHTIDTLPARPQIDETVLILGTGIAGCTTGWVLSEVGYKVIMVERLDEPFSSTSIGALGIHLGGRYPRDWQTAIECLQSGILMKRLMSFAFSGTRLRFLVAEDSPVSLEAYLEFYANLARYYSNLPIRDQLFGAPDDFFRVLRKDELSAFSGISGGIITQEACFDMDAVRSTLLRTLLARDVTILTSHEVTSIKRTSDKTGLEVAIQDIINGESSVICAPTVINTTGPSVRLLGQALGDTPMCRIDLRFFHDIELDEQTQAQYPYPFVVIPGYMHYVPLGGSMASLVGFHDAIGTVEAPAGEKLDLPPSWREQLLSREVRDYEILSAKILSEARSRFMPHLGTPTVRSVYPGVVVSFNSEQHMKRQTSAVWQTDVTGYYSANPTKASHALLLALEILRHVADRKKEILVSNSYVRGIFEGNFIAYSNSNETVQLG